MKKQKKKRTIPKDKFIENYRIGQYTLIHKEAKRVKINNIQNLFLNDVVSKIIHLYLKDDSIVLKNFSDLSLNHIMIYSKERMVLEFFENIKINGFEISKIFPYIEKSSYSNDKPSLNINNYGHSMFDSFDQFHCFSEKDTDFRKMIFFIESIKNINDERKSIQEYCKEQKEKKNSNIIVFDKITSLDYYLKNPIFPLVWLTRNEKHQLNIAFHEL